MLDDLAEFFRPREEEILLGKTKLVVRELDGAADNSALKDEEDRQWKLLVRCVFRENGEPAFTDSDIPALKRKGPVAKASLIAAVNRVNGLDTGEEAKNSDAAPASGS